MTSQNSTVRRIERSFSNLVAFSENFNFIWHTYCDCADKDRKCVLDRNKEKRKNLGLNQHGNFLREATPSVVND